MCLSECDAVGAAVIENAGVSCPILRQQKRCKKKVYLDQNESVIFAYVYFGARWIGKKTPNDWSEARCNLTTTPKLVMSSCHFV